MSQLAVAGPPPGGGGDPPRYPDGTIVKTSAPIELPGGGGVSDSGGATYDLPLAVPDGPQGMQPLLSLAYAGRANGALGVGFGLTGLSIIAPCTKSIASEGYADGADFGIGELAEEGFADSSPDSYCLDGQKLVAFGDPGFVLPTTGVSTTFHTETETFVHVVAHRANASDVQPDWFDVHARDGGVRRYVPIYGNQLTGVDASTRPEAGAPIAIVYVLSESKDRNGNLITYKYDHADEQEASEVAFRPIEIDYAFSDGATPSRRIELIYESRPDPIVHFIHGVKLVTRSRLSAIEAWAPNPTSVERVWTYHLGYQSSADTGRSLLATVQMCDQFAVCSWTRSFEWTSTAHGPGVTEHVAVEGEFGAASLSYDQASLDWYNATENQAANWLRPTDTRILVYDMDGDGDDDALYRTERTLIRSGAVTWLGFLVDLAYGRIQGELNVRLSSETQPLDLMHYDVTELLEPRWGDQEKTGASIELGKSRVADLDGDGLLDLVAARTQIDHTEAEQNGSNGNVWTQDLWRYGYATYYGRKFDHFAEYPFDANQLGFDSVAIHGPVLRWDDYTAEMMVSHPPFQRIVADLDGDGRAEQIDSVDQDVDVLAYPGINWDSPYDYAGGGFPYHTTLSSDGAPAVFDESWTCGNGHAMVVDLDGDGRQEVLVAGDVHDDNPDLDSITGSPGTYKRLAMSDPWGGEGTHGAAGTARTSALWAGDCGGETPDLVMGDWNGDGLVDALYPPGSYGGNANPIVRWNLGNDTFGPNDAVTVTGAPGITALMGQPAPIGRQGMPVPWDRGTRVADVDGDGRSDLIAFRQDNAACVDPFIANPIAPPVWTCPQHVVVFRSQGDHFAGEEVFNWDNGQLSLAQGFTTAQIGDANGDGAVDAISVAGGKLRVLELPWRQTPDLLARVRDTGAAYPVETFGYTRSWWGDHPRNEASSTNPEGPATCEWPIACPARGSTVVRTHQIFAGTRTDGTAMFSNTFHKYSSPRVSLIGRGSLGFGDHQIWDRERGAWTDRVLDNQTAVDPEPGLPGGVFYPNVGAPSAILDVTPRSPAPTVAEINAPGIGPGLTPSMLIDVRVESSSTGYDTRSDASGRILTVLPVYQADNVVESQAAPELSTMTPSYQAVSAGGGRYTTTTADYDAYGNATRSTTTIATMLGGAAQVTREVTATFENRPDTWMLGLPTRTVTTAFDVDDVDHPGRVVRTDHDVAGNTISIETNAIGRGYAACVAATGDQHGCETKSSTVTLVYDPYGNPTTTTTTAIDGIVPRIVSTTWDPDHVYPVTTTQLNLTTTTLIHPALGVPIQVTDPDGVTNATYDGFGRITSATRLGASSLTRTYNEVIDGNRRGLKTTDVRGDGQQSWERTDERGRIVDTARLGFGGSAWIYARQEFDNLGQLARASNPSFLPIPSAWTTTVRDRLGQALAITTPDSQTTVVEPSLFSTTTWDPATHETYQLRDVAGRTIESGHHVGSGAPYGELHFQYGPFDQVEQVTDTLGNKTSITHDELGRVIDEIDPDTGETTSAYDGFGELVHQERANGDTFDHMYDALGRTIVTTGPDGTTERFYDDGTGATGKPTRIDSPDGVTTRLAYDTLGRLHTIAQTVDGVTRSIGRRYDGYGRVKNVFYPDVTGFDRFTIGYTYGTDGFLRSIGDVSACHLSTSQDAIDPACTPSTLWQVTSRDAWLALTGAKFGTTIPVTRSFDALTGRQTQLSAAGKTTAYGYDADGLLISRYEPATNRTETFAYDDLHRLLDWTMHGPKARDGSTPPTIDTKYDYDPIGNLLSASGTTPFTGVFGYSGRPHALKSSNVGGAYDYDKVGRQIHGGGRTTTWSQFDLPDTITTGATSRSFRYDGNGGRVTRSDASGTITYLGRLYEHRQLAGSGTSDVFYVDGEPGVVAQVEYAGVTKKVRYIVGDTLDSQSLVLKSTGVVDDQAYYDPFGGRVDANGQPIVDPDPSTSRGFTGHEDDGGGLVNMQGRIYDRNQYRFLSPDPIISAPLFGQSYNPYSYVLNSPLNFTDPSGFEPQTVEETVVTAPPPEQQWVCGIKEGTTTLNDGTEVQEITFIGGFRTLSTDDGAAPPTKVVRPASPRKAIPSVEKKEPWQLDNPARDFLAVAYHVLSESDSTLSEKLFIGASAALSVPGALDRMTANMVIATPQAPYVSFDAYEQHHQAALAQEHNHANEAATDEWLAMAQEGSLGVGETAILALGFVPGAAAAQAEPTVYSVAFEVELGPAELGLSRGRHFQIANQALEAEKAVNPVLADLVPTPAGWGKPPAGWVWQHATIDQAAGREGVLHLVPKYQHTPGSAWWRVLHPLPNGGGGYTEWAIPNGAPPN